MNNDTTTKITSQDNINKAREHIEKGHLEELKLMLKEGKIKLEDCIEHERTLLAFSTKLQKENIVKHLIEIGANTEALDRWGHTSLYLAAAEERNIVISEALLKAKANPYTGKPDLLGNISGNGMDKNSINIANLVYSYQLKYDNKMEDAIDKLASKSAEEQKTFLEKALERISNIEKTISEMKTTIETLPKKGK